MRIKSLAAVEAPLVEAAAEAEEAKERTERRAANQSQAIAVSLPDGARSSSIRLISFSGAQQVVGAGQAELGRQIALNWPKWAPETQDQPASYCVSMG